MKLIAETAWHHEGDVSFLMKLANEIKNSDAHIAKFHLALDIDEYIDESHVLYEGYHKWKISRENWVEILKGFAPDELMLLCNDRKAIEFAASLNPAIIELHAVCMLDLHLLDTLKEHCPQETTIALGISGNTLDEIDFVLRYLGRKNILLMYGFQNYPTKFSNINFAKLKKIMDFYPNVKFGYADHCGFDEPFNMLVTTIGASLGVDYIEKHITIAEGQKRLDYEAAIDVGKVAEIVETLQIIETSMGDGRLEFNSGEQNYARTGTLKKAPFLVRSVERGEQLSKDDLVFKRCKCDEDFPPFSVVKMIGKYFQAAIPAGTILKPQDLGEAAE